MIPTHDSDNSSEIKERAQAQWKTLPVRYQYSGDLKLHNYKSIERDFIASGRLNYLHALFMLRQASLHNANEPDAELLSVCAEVLNLTAKTIIMKTRLTNSGTGLIWKVRVRRSSYFHQLTKHRSVTTASQPRACCVWLCSIHRRLHNPRCLHAHGSSRT